MCRRILLILWLLFGVLVCRGQVTDLPLYDDLTVRAEYMGDGRFMVDSTELVMLIALARELKGQVGTGSAIVKASEDCGVLMERSIMLGKEKDEIWSKRIELLEGRGDWYMERMKEEMKAGKGKAVRNAIWGGLAGLGVGIVVGALVW